MNKKMLAGTAYVLLACTAMIIMPELPWISNSYLTGAYVPVSGLLSGLPVLSSTGILLLAALGAVVAAYWVISRLRGSQREMQAVLSQVPGGFCKLAWLPTPKVLYCSKGMAALLGQAAVPTLLLEYIDPEEYARVSSCIDQAYNQGKLPYELEFRITGHGGDVIWVLVRGSFGEDKGQLVTYWAVIDITAVKQNELKCKASCEYLQMAVELSDEIVFDYDPVKDEIHLSAKSAEQFDCPSVIQDTERYFRESGVFSPEDISRISKGLALLRAGEPRVDINFRVSLPGGNVRWYDARVINVLDSNGDSVQIIGVVKEITGIKNLELERRYKSLMVSDCVYAYEANVTKDCLAGEYTQGFEITLGSYTAFVESTALEKVHPGDQIAFAQKFKKENILLEFHQGRYRSYFEYRAILASPEGAPRVHWVLSTVILTKDQTGDIRMFCYVNDIDEQKKKEFYLQEQKKYHDAVLADTIGSFEADLTHDHLIKGYDDWLEGIDCDDFGSYSNMIKLYAGYKVHHEDADTFLNALLPEHAMELFHLGQSDITIEYRCPDGRGNFIWVSCTVHLIEDKYADCIKCFGYIKDINNKKLKEISLEYKAQRDDLSGMYNKSATETLITEYLESPESMGKTHALLMIDLDNFKLINDSQGHSFGDWVLSNISMQIKGLFRGTDIVGRVGGDEFVAFIKNIGDGDVVALKCAQLSKAINSTYHSESGECSVTGSIGVALYPYHGTSFKELYRKADSALYESKGGGKNMYTLYEELGRS